jgi:hypothetical protein
MLEAISSKFVDVVAVDPALAIAIPTPEGQGIVIGPVAVTTIFRLLASVVAVAQFLAVGISPGG